MPLYDFVCDCGEVTEARRGIEVFLIPCPACGKKAIRDFPRNVGLSGLPTRSGVVERRYNVSEFQEAQHEVIHDQERGKLPRRDLWEMGKRKAEKLRAAGIEHVKDAPYA